MFSINQTTGFICLQYYLKETMDNLHILHADSDQRNEEVETSILNKYGL